jgi:hypothetical protein
MAVGVVFGLVVIAGAVAFLMIRRGRLRAKCAMSELLANYFRGGMPANQLGRRARESAGLGFLDSQEFQSLAVAAFQRAAGERLIGKPHTMKDETELLNMLAAVREEFGLPERYRIEGWRAGRE